MYIIIVLAIAANKSDLYENEEVNEDEVKQKGSSMGRSRNGLLVPGLVVVPFCWAITSALCSST